MMIGTATLQRETVEFALRMLQESTGKDWKMEACRDCGGLGREENLPLPEPERECVTCQGRGYLFVQVAPDAHTFDYDTANANMHALRDAGYNVRVRLSHGMYTVIRDDWTVLSQSKIEDLLSHADRRMER